MSWQRRAKDLDVLNPGSTTDEYLNAVPDWTSPTTTTVRGLIQQTGSVEVTDGRDTIVSELVAILPIGTAVSSYSRISQGGVTYEVVGNPVTYDTGSPGLRHIEARLATSAG